MKIHPDWNEPQKAAILGKPSLRSRWMILLLTLFCALHLAAQPGLPSGSGSNPWLDSWSFTDTNYWTSDLGYYPILFTNLSVLTSNGPGNSLLIDTTNVSQLLFGTWNSDGTTNLDVTGEGSLMFWFNPDWNSVSLGGLGPGGLWSAVIDLGAYTSNATYGSWGCGFDSAGNNFYFITQDADGHEGDYIYTPVALTAGNWNLIALTWSSTNSTFYLNGALVTNGPGVGVLPSLGVISNGFAIGSDAATGLLQMHGAMNHLTTYNYQLSAGTIGAEWVLNGVFYFGGDATPDITQAPFTPQAIPTFDAVTGPGYLLVVSSNSGCGNNTNVWLTNTTAVMTNGAVNLTFTIAGGSNGLPYDVFATPALAKPLTNGTWTWMGQGYQCCTYTIPGLTNSDVFLLLGTPQDSYGNGLTDAYELLVLHQNPADGSKSGDGMLDGWKVLWGMNPLINNTAQPSERANYTYDGTGRLETNSGVSYSGFSPEGFGFDAEGNILNDQP
jgi:hypothetical protein